MCRLVAMTYFNKTEWGRCKKSVCTHYWHQSIGFSLWWWAYNVPTYLTIMLLRTFAFNGLLVVCFDGSLYCFVRGNICKRWEWCISRMFASSKIACQRNLNRFLLLGIWSFCFVCVERSRWQAQVGLYHVLIGRFTFERKVLFDKIFDRFLG